MIGTPNVIEDGYLPIPVHQREADKPNFIKERYPIGPIPRRDVLEFKSRVNLLDDPDPRCWPVINESRHDYSYTGPFSIDGWRV